MIPNLSTGKKGSGFTLIELLVVIAIIGVLASIVMVSVENARMKGRDAGRKTQIQEMLKALELHYSDSGQYPQYGSPLSSNTGGPFTGIDPAFYITGTYLKRMPDEGARYFYCVSADRKSILLGVNTEEDKGATGSDYCHVVRGTGPYGCTYLGAGVDVDADDSCASRF